jgi:hypothetical protein
MPGHAAEIGAARTCAAGAAERVEVPGRELRAARLGIELAVADRDIADQTTKPERQAAQGTAAGHLADRRAGRPDRTVIPVSAVFVDA